MTTLSSERIEAALQRALDGEPAQHFFDLVDRASGLPGPRPNVDALRAFGARLAGEGKAGEPLLEEMLAHTKLSLVYVATMALATQASKPKDKRALTALMDLADHVEKPRRDAVRDGLVMLLVQRADEGAAALLPLCDGYLHAHVALDALTQRSVLDRLSRAESVLDLLSDAFSRADDAPRSADRSQGMRTLRAGLPDQIARTAARFREALPWIETRLTSERPETRQVIEETITKLRKQVGEAQADAMRLVFAGAAKPPRDPSRIVQGTRKRSRGR